MSHGGDVDTRRFAREVIIDLLWGAAGGPRGAGFTLAHICAGFLRSQSRVEEPDVRRALRDLESDGLIDRKWDPDLGDDFYTLASRGMDFRTARYPWDRLDEFTGKQP